MIEAAFVIKSSGEILYKVKYVDDKRNDDVVIPSHVKACVTLFTSRESTSIGHPYTLDQNGYQWIYIFFDSFTLVVKTKSDIELPTISRRMVALGRRIAQSYGNYLGLWSGDMSELEGMDALFDRYLITELDQTGLELLPTIETLLDSALENPDLAYAGIIDASGNMLGGNIPDNHLSYIKEELVHEAVSPQSDIVPTVYEVLGYDVQILRVQSLTVVCAPHKDGSKVGVKAAASELAQSLSEQLH